MINNTYVLKTAKPKDERQKIVKSALNLFR